MQELLFNVFVIAYAALAGLAVGSFLNVVADRLPEGRSLVQPPSSCPVCGHRLGTRDLIPVLSWVLLRGRCRYCGAPIPARLPAVEALTGILYGLVAAGARTWSDGLIRMVLVTALLTAVLLLSGTARRRTGPVRTAAAAGVVLAATGIALATLWPLLF